VLRRPLESALHSAIAVVDYGRLHVGRRRRRSCGLNWRNCRSAENILFLHSFSPNFQPWATWSREIGRELNRQSPWPLDIQEQSLITAPSEAKFAEYLGALYTQRPPDLIVALGAPAAHFVQ
jgi:hypothetical protein